MLPTWALFFPSMKCNYSLFEEYLYQEDRLMSFPLRLVCHNDYFVLSKTMHSSAMYFVSWNLLNTEDVSILLLRYFFMNVVITGPTRTFCK